MNQGNSQVGTAPREVGALEGQLNEHAHGISELAQQIDSLESAMCNVLRPEPAAPPAPATPSSPLTSVSPVPSPLVSEVRQQQNRVQQLIGRVNSMRNRLEG